MDNSADYYSGISMVKDNSEPDGDVAFETLLYLDQEGLNLVAILILVKERVTSHKSDILLNELLIVYMQKEFASCYFF